LGWYTSFECRAPLEIGYDDRLGVLFFRCVFGFPVGRVSQAAFVWTNCSCAGSGLAHSVAACDLLLPLLRRSVSAPAGDSGRVQASVGGALMLSIRFVFPR